jgi:hypothetical protein
MKQTVLSVSLITCSFILFLSSCEVTTTYPRDTSLAGSTSIDYRRIKECKGIFGEDSLENFQSDGSSVLTTGKVSDEEMDLFCLTKWGDQSIDIFFPVIPLSGEPYNVNFDYSATDAKVKYNTTEWEPVNASIHGWIKRVDFDNARNAVKSTKSESDPATFRYACDINISCIVNGQNLTLKITSIEP